MVRMLGGYSYVCGMGNDQSLDRVRREVSMLEVKWLEHRTKVHKRETMATVLMGSFGEA